MHSITDIVIKLTNAQVVALANQIKDEIQDELLDHICTGAAYNSFSIGFQGKGEAIAYGDFATGAEGSFSGGFLNYVVIGSNEPSAYYLDQGNGGPGRRIASTRHTDSRGRVPAKLHLEHIGPDVYAPSVRGYKGIHYIKKVADRHR